jgi:[ribosomal protein S5]-alanine N-acetyltransferase
MQKKMNTPPYHDFPNLNNEKVSLRQILDSDVSQLIEISFYDSIQASSLAEAVSMNMKINDDYLNGNSIHWGIIDNHSQQIVGTCGYYRGFENAEGELGCVLLPQFSGRGFMTSAMRLAMDFGIEYMGLIRIKAVTGVQNMSAIRLLERLNFRKVSVTDDTEIEYEFVRD